MSSVLQGLEGVDVNDPTVREWIAKMAADKSEADKSAKKE